MKNLDPRYLEQRRLAKMGALGKELKEPGSVVFLGTTASGFTVYGVASLLLISYDIWLKLFG